MSVQPTPTPPWKGGESVCTLTQSSRYALFQFVLIHFAETRHGASPPHDLGMRSTRIGSKAEAGLRLPQPPSSAGSEQARAGDADRPVSLTAGVAAGLLSTS